MELRPGQKLYSAVSDAQFVVVRAPSSTVEIECGGVAVLDAAPESVDASAAPEGEGVLVGKRYVDEDTELELLCSKAGGGTVSVDGRPVTLKGAKPLPSSD